MGDFDSLVDLKQINQSKTVLSSIIYKDIFDMFTLYTIWIVQSTYTMWFAMWFANQTQSQINQINPTMQLELVCVKNKDNIYLHGDVLRLKESECKCTWTEQSITLYIASTFYSGAQLLCNTQRVLQCAMVN